MNDVLMPRKETMRVATPGPKFGAYCGVIGRARQIDLLRLADDADLTCAHVELTP